MARPLLRAFPLPLGVGTDICHIPRIYKILSGPESARFIKKVMTDDERKDPWLLWVFRPREKTSGDLHDTLLWKAAAFLAGRFAAKEAVFKSHGMLRTEPRRQLGFQDIVIEIPDGGYSRRSGSGPPVARIKAAEGEGSEDRCALVSISHDGEYATAVCIAHGPVSDMYTE